MPLVLMLENEVNRTDKGEHKKAWKIVAGDAAKGAGRFLKDHWDFLAIAGFHLLDSSLGDLVTSIDSNIDCMCGGPELNLIANFTDYFNAAKPYLYHILPQVGGAVTELVSTYRNSRKKHGKINSALRAVEGATYRFARNYVTHVSFEADYYGNLPTAPQWIAMGVTDGLKYGIPFSRLGTAIGNGIKKLSNRHTNRK